MFKYIIALVLLSSAAFAQEPTIPHPPRDIYMRGMVDENMAYRIGEQIKLLNLLGSEEITIHITSPGGSVYSGLQIYDYMEESVSPIRTVCEGYCMSMAAVLLASGDIRAASASATIMFHQLSTEARGKLSEIQAEVNDGQRLQDIIDAHIHEHTGLSISAIKKMESYDHMMSPQEAKYLGIIDMIVGKHGK